MRFARMAAPPGPPERGFGDCFNDLVARRLQELGQSWANVPRRSRRAEAARRAREEMVRRLAVRGGRRYAESTIARWAARNQWPPTVEPFWLQRWATIDRAGGIAALAAAVRSTVRRVIAWRDSPDPHATLPTPAVPKAPDEPQRIGVIVTGYATIGSTVIEKPVPSRPGQQYQVLIIDPDSAIMDAWYAGDDDELAELLGTLIGEQVISQWTSASQHSVSYQVTQIIEFLPNIDD